MKPRSATERNEPAAIPGANQDSAWKEMLNVCFPAFVAFFFPKIHAELDWARGYESLDKELAQIHPAHVTGRLIADKLFKVWLKSGKVTWLLVHVEVQDQAGKGFARRIYVYNYRLVDAFGVEVVSLAVVTGGNRKSADQPIEKYETGRWDCALSFQFPCVRLADYADRLEELEQSRNPFGIAVLVTLKSQETKGDAEWRLAWKRRILFGLYRKGYNRKEIINLFRFMDWVMTLPKELEEKLRREVFKLEEGQKLPFLSRMEISAITDGWEKGIREGRQVGRREGWQEGRQEGRQEGQDHQRAFILRLLGRQIGEISESLNKKLLRLPMEQMEALGEALLDFESKADLTAWLKTQTTKRQAARAK